MADEFRTAFDKLPGPRMRADVIPVPAGDGEEGGGEGGLRYDILTQTNPEYDGKLFDELEDLYVGGYRIQKNANRYLMQMPNEHEAIYSVRCKTASYTPYFGSIVDQFTADLFGSALSIHPAADADNPNTPGDLPDEEFYQNFADDADRQGNDFGDLMKMVTTTALKKGYALVAIDAPTDDPKAPPPETRAEEERRGTLRFYAYELPVEQLIDWEKDELDSFEFAVIKKKETRRKGPRGKRDEVVETFTVWTIEEKAHWERFEIKYKVSQSPKADTIVPMVAEGTTSFDRIPILCLELPEGLWVGNKIGTQAKEHYQRRTSLIAAQYRSLVSIPVVYLGPEITAAGESMPSEIQQNPGRGRNPVKAFEDRGCMVLGAGDKFEFSEPEGHCYELVDKQLTELKDEMYRVNHQMAASVSNRPSSLQRSGLSKQKDQEITARVLRALGEIVRDFGVQIYETISEARGEDVIWTAHGLDSYDVGDRQEILEEAIQLDSIQIPSQTFKKEIKRATAQKLLLGIEPQTLATIFDEIDEGVENEHEVSEMKMETEKVGQEAQQEIYKNPEMAVQKPKAPKLPLGAPKSRAA